MLTRGPHGIPTERQIRRAALRERAFALRQAGKTYAAIARDIGLSLERTRQLVLKAERLILRPRWYDRLPARVQNVLHNAGLTALPEAEAANAVARLSRRELLAVRNIGRAAVDAVVAWLADHGLKLRPESAHAFATRLRREAPDNDEGGSFRDRPLSDSEATDPFAAGRNEHETPCPYTTDKI
jgi:hypothetical protein